MDAGFHYFNFSGRIFLINTMFDGGFMRIAAHLAFLSLSVSLSVALVSCQPAGRTVPGSDASRPGSAGASAVQEGEGWSREAGKRWVFHPSAGLQPDMHLVTFNSDVTAEQIIRLPRGAKKAVIRKISVAYCGPGRFEWQIRSDDGQGNPAQKRHAWSGSLAALPPGTLEKGEGFWVHQNLDVPVEGGFWLVFNGNADVCARENAGKEGVLFLRVQGETPEKREYRSMPHVPFVRIELENVQ